MYRFKYIIRIYMKKKILLVASFLFLFPLTALAGRMDMFADRCGGYGYMGMHHGMFWLCMLAVIALAIWTVVGILAAMWLWEHVGKKPAHHTSHEE